MSNLNINKNNVGWQQHILLQIYALKTFPLQKRVNILHLNSDNQKSTVVSIYINSVGYWNDDVI